MKANLSQAAVALMLLARPVLASPVELVPRVPIAQTGCDKYAQCPDSISGVDLHSVLGPTGWKYWIRWNQQNRCYSVEATEQGCAVVKLYNGLEQRVCFDWRTGVGEWWDDRDVKTCYRLKSEYVCGEQVWQSWILGQIKCPR